MSQWTHVLGVIRFDSFNKNVWPAPENKKEIIRNEKNTVHKFFTKSDIPRGSEGPIEIQTIMTNRGPTVILTGDLRDFGKEGIQSIVDWLNAVIKSINFHESFNHEYHFPLYLRDIIVHCNVEYHEKDLYIQENDNEKEIEEFPVKLYERKRKEK